MKTHIYLSFLLLLGLQARGDDGTIQKWGVITNGIQMSIALDGRDRDINTNEQFQLLVQIKNLGASNAWSYVENVANSESGSGLHCDVVSPSGKDISPNIEFRGEGGGFINLLSGTTNSFKFDLSSICKFNEIGLYKITAQKAISQGEKSWTVTSNPLFVKVIRAK